MRLLRSKGALFNVRADFQYIAPVASKSYARFKSCQNWVKNNHHASLVLIRHGFCTKFQYLEAFCSFSLVYLQIVSFNFAVNSTKINPFSASKCFFQFARDFDEKCLHRIKSCYSRAFNLEFTVICYKKILLKSPIPINLGLFIKECEICCI